MFPDVLLFGDKSTNMILQGWELKMPDTKIDDPELLSNATKKAQALKLDSFLLWNVTHARLYLREEDSDEYNIHYAWDSLNYITERSMVESEKASWQELASEIIGDLNNYFDRGEIRGGSFIEAFQDGGIASLILENSSVVSQALSEKSRQDRNLRDEVMLWWHHSELDYKSSGTSDPQYDALAEMNLFNWIAKFLFAHVLKASDSRAQIVETINEQTTPAQALQVFEEISMKCNFAPIFSDTVGLSILPSTSWRHLTQFNRLLLELNISDVPQDHLSNILESITAIAVRKLRGQYTTPVVLAHLLVELCVYNIEDDRVIDPCCGSGTIARAVLKQKLAHQITAEAAIARVFAGDIDEQAAQITLLALARADFMGFPLRVYNMDAFDLEKTSQLEFKHPEINTKIEEDLGEFDAIITNLPFVSQGGRQSYEKQMDDINGKFHEGIKLPKKADIAAYIPFALESLLKPGGRLGIIITNAWLGTLWGHSFFDLIIRNFTLDYVITSGVERWFKNSKVVTNILILTKRDDLNSDQTGVASKNQINFITLNKSLAEIANSNTEQAIASEIRQLYAKSDTINIRSVTHKKIKEFRFLGLGGNAQFVDCDWLLDLPLVPVSDCYQIYRGERRGWDSLFYPKGEHGIESGYIKPVLKSPANVNTYITEADSQAFSCSKSMRELRNLNHSGAIKWIEKFENQKNTKGKLLRNVLEKPNHFWYEMKTDTMANLVVPINPGDRLFVAKLQSPAFVNQRLVCLQAKNEDNIDICHALLNSTIGLFIIEGMGSGRGEGVLDLNSDKIKQFMHMLDHAKLEESVMKKILAGSEKVLTRKILALPDELKCSDRAELDQSIIDAYNLKIELGQVHDSLLTLYGIRQAALNNT